uniref:AlNc14C24G2420 protein n=1 Tax=Albugo laibachii Nc14 TaxID=890382 RepID=F0W6C1_9STRA|nr:AlNc14C24G2420 [Albugo laibachii Nc14]|eukprot:CCA16664.1 AlNc14C24G2420 [Albugo laibachii Nc14]
MVACVSADGFVVPAALILPGKRLNRDVCDACNISGATILTSEAGFMTTYAMREYIAAFELAVPLPIKWPLILVFDGASSHMDLSIDAVAAAFGLRLVQLQPNASQPHHRLDVAVFRAVKTIMKEQMYSFMIATGKTAMTKKEAVQFASAAWRLRIEEKSRKHRSWLRGGRDLATFSPHDVKTSQKFQRKRFHGTATLAILACDAATYSERDFSFFSCFQQERPPQDSRCQEASLDPGRPAQRVAKSCKEAVFYLLRKIKLLKRFET